MKRIFAFLALAAVLAVQRIYMCGLSGIRADGSFTVYANGYERLDIEGDEETARKGIQDLCAEILWEEQFDGLLIIYAYSPRIYAYQSVHGKRVNIMVAIKDGKLAFGSPLLLGSY